MSYDRGELVIDNVLPGIIKGITSYSIYLKDSAQNWMPIGKGLNTSVKGSNVSYNIPKYADTKY